MAKKDINQLAKSILDIATGETKDKNIIKKAPEKSVKGRSGGLKGGSARANKLTAKQRSEIAKKAASARWNKES